MGLSSFANQIPFVTGKRATDEQDDMKKEINAGNKRKVDDWPFIWNLYSAKGYETMFNEDKQGYSIFYWPDNGGFENNPFHHYYRYFWTTLEETRDKSPCYFNLPIPKIHVDITRRHVVTGQDKLQFMYSSLTECSHLLLNDDYEIDSIIKEFWQDLYENNFLNKTAVLFISDHGLHAGPHMQYLIGNNFFR